MSPASPLPVAALSRLRITHRSFLTRSRGRHVCRSAVGVEYRPEQQKKVLDHSYARVINAEVVHGDEQKFWGERRTFYTQRNIFFPMWDRCAQALILITREVPRVPQEMAFRLMAVFLKLMLLPRLMMNTELMLPMWIASNAEGAMAAAKDGSKGKEQSSKQQGESKDDAKKEGDNTK
ncbi:hypothetical protein, conserved [Trypanosoma brucei gambiense DAL972]|uniref:Uncharacterized protein n=2 Tax=Trypanosoma brucei TaxID=5691 RepID=C9ZPD1_TRYB9|nr:hypothetical protein, conserved [Trypanosoma brucei gambiense DAL972]RHW72628.1 hypothetical protein DPX39_050034600 [Trypanosoma brucei equiperdum]6HIV_AJ Chain AJ, uL10m [Trypanosoma brucei brucei]6HIX_AJ Chain AJ, ul10m [Trypanosoma brucei brucei]CBH11259.1 hypothetical protein, conserved [Trypanosoma brucei gambiense DAL972]|eukprot:XP_011773546.1 hypothetical protein, conserved [Trypanosoma brucei gambiense DAL972]